MGKYALLIGVGEYGEGLQPLPAAPNDVAALKKVLEDPKVAGFDEVKAIVNPTHAEMAREIELWFQGRQKDDLIMLFFSGHGLKDENRDLYFAARNTEKQRDFLVRSTATSARFINDCIRRCKAKYQVVILDCCFSGAFGELVPRDAGNINLETQLGAEGWVVLTSTNAVDYSFEEKGQNLSIYTRFLVEGISSGAADLDDDGVITAEELHQYAARKVKELSPIMSPKIFIPNGEGYRIKLARSPQNFIDLKCCKETQKSSSNKEREAEHQQQAPETFSRQQFLKLGALVCTGLIAAFGTSQIFKESLSKINEKIELEAIEPIVSNLPGIVENSSSFFEEKYLELSNNARLRTDYLHLEELLSLGEWKAADQKTLSIMLKLANQEGTSQLDYEKLHDFPCDVLRKIDRLWIEASNGKFGFSVQKKIYFEECGGTLNDWYDETAWHCFFDTVEWRVNGFRSDVGSTFSEETVPTGFLPGQATIKVGPLGWGYMGWSGQRWAEEASGWGSLFSRCETCEI